MTAAEEDGLRATHGPLPDQETPRLKGLLVLGFILASPVEREIVMNFKSKMVGVFGAAIMTFGMLASASAAGTTADVNVKVSQPDGAVIAASITGGRFSEVKYRAGNDGQNATGTIVVTATDTRGAGTGWTVSLAGGGDFKDGDKSFALGAFSLQPGSIVGQGSANANGITPSAVGSVSTTQQTLMVAAKNKGLGVFDSTINGTIKVPDNTLVGDYKTTLTVSIVAST